MGIGSELKYSAKFGIASSQTWSYEISDETTFVIFPGKSVCKYQYVFHGNFDTFKLGFQSSIFADTDCTTQPENIWED